MKIKVNSKFLKKISFLAFFGLSLTTFIACSSEVVQKTPDKTIDGEKDPNDDIIVLPSKPAPGSPGTANPFPNNGVFENTKQVAGYPVSAKAYETANSEYRPHIASSVHQNSSTKDYQKGVIPNEQYSFINDYTVSIKIFTKARDGLGNVQVPNRKGQIVGTGWVLDFLPTTDGTYPKTWFYATNAHVVADMKFPNNSQFPDVQVPSNEQYGEFDGLQLVGAIGKDGKATELVESNKITQSSKAPQLLYVAHNFLGPTVTLASFGANSTKGPGQEQTYSDYFKDFAVLKFDFETEEEAKRITRNFAEKYKNQKTKFAAKTLMTKTADELREYQDVYVLGYPSDSRIPTINKEEDDNDYSIGSQLSFRDNYQIVNKFGQKLNGMANSQNVSPTLDLKYGIAKNSENKQQWMQRVGLVYSIEDDFLKAGASGSMVINKQKEVLGIQHSNGEKTRTGYADPLISEGFTIDGKIIFPAYDLIYGGAKDQVNSFKQSMQKYYKGKTSWLLGKL